MLPRDWRAIRPDKRDLVLAAAVLAFGQLVTWARLDEASSFEGPRWLNAAWNAAFLASFAWRRRAPEAAVAAAVTVYFLPLLLWAHDLTLLGSFVPLVLLTALAGYHCPTGRRAALTLGIAAAGVVVVSLTVPELGRPVDLLYNSMVLVLPWLMARALRAREERARALGMQLMRERSEREAASREIAVQERARIARELHDVVAHSVSVMVVQIGAARMRSAALGASPEEPLLAAEEVGRQALADLRQLLGVLRADVEDPSPAAPEAPQPGLARLDGMVDQLRAAGLAVCLERTGAPRELPAVLDLTAFRIVQEALTNTVRHSGATEAMVRVTFAPASVRLEVTDNGGPGPDDRERQAVGHGLVGIRERTALFGGTVEAGPRPGGGWRLAAELPVQHPAAVS